MHTSLRPLSLVAATFIASCSQAQTIEDFSRFVRQGETFFSGSWASTAPAPSEGMKQGDGFYEIRGDGADESFVDFYPSANKTLHAFTAGNHVSLKAKVLQGNRARNLRILFIDASGRIASAVFSTSFFSGTGFSTQTAPLARSPGFDPRAVERVRIVSGQATGSDALAIALDELSNGDSPLSLPSGTRNFSAKGRVGQGSEALIAGFLVEGPSTRQMLVRAVGPGLAGFGLANALTDPQLQVFTGSTLIAANDNWTGGTTLVEATQAAGAFALANGSRDAAALVGFADGVHSAVVTSAGGTTPGIALLELYRNDDTTDALPTWSNFSARGYSGAGAARLVAGFVIRGQAIRQHLIRVAGPSLMGLGVASGTLADPKLQLSRIVDGIDMPVAENDDWGANSQAVMAGAFAEAGAFRFATGSKDAALVVHLPPGIYTVAATSTGNSEGIALIEVYELR